MPRAHAQVHSISSLARSPREDREKRMRAYIVAMVIRTVAFIACGFFVMAGYTAAAWVCVAAAIALPYPAVVIANGVDRRTHVDPHETPDRLALTQGAAAGAGVGATDAPRPGGQGPAHAQSGSTTSSPPPGPWWDDDDLEDEAGERDVTAARGEGPEGRGSGMPSSTGPEARPHTRKDPWWKM